MTSEDKEMCPLCMEPMEADDLAFFPCDCRYQICRFCWTKIINEENGLCPACRKEYNSEKPASYKPVTDPDDARGKPNKKRKDYMKKKLSPEMLKVLPDLRVVQPNLIFVVGLPTSISKEILRGQDYFGRYGKIYKVEINQNQTFGGPQGQQSFSAYITFHRAEDAMRSIRELNQSTLCGRPIRVSLGTTKYCSQFLKGTKCTKHECMYLHELGDPAASFTKEEMQAGKHTEYMNKLLNEYSQSTSASSTRHDLGTINCSNLGSNATDGEENSIISDYMRETDVHHNNLGDEEVNSRSTNASKLSGPNRNGSQSSHTSDPRSPRSAVGDGRKTRKVEKNYQNMNHNSDVKSNNHNNNNNVNNNSNNNNCTDVPECWNQSCSTSNYNSNYCSKKPLRNQAFNSFGVLSNPQSETITNEHNIPNKADNQLIHNSRGVTTVGNPVQSWYNSTSTNTAPKHRALNDDNIDIDFDPFRESQQGLAELLAAEIAQLDVGDSVNSRLNYDVNGHLNSHIPNMVDIANKSYNLFLESNLLENVERGGGGGYNAVQPKRQNYPWFSNCIQLDKESASCINHSNHSNSSTYTSTVYPPPGFEEATKGRQTSPDVPLFPSSNSGNQLDSRFQDSSCPVYPGNTDYGNTSLSNSNGPYSVDVKSNSLIEKSGSMFPGFENWLPNKANSKGSTNPMSFSDSTNFHSPSEFSSSFKSDQPLQNQQQQQSNQLMANIFAAAFNTASAMLNNGSSGSSDKSQGRQQQPFDLNLIFNQLCRQSSLFSSLNNHNLQPEWQNNYSNSSVRTNTNQPEDFLDASSMATAAAVTAAACALFPSSKHPPRSDFQGQETFGSQDRDPYARCNPGRCPSKVSIHSQPTASPDVFQDNGYTCTSAPDMVLDHETGSSIPWQLDDPAIVSSRLSSKMWRSGSNFQQFFNPSLLTTFNSDASHGNFHHHQQPPQPTPSQQQQQQQQPQQQSSHQSQQPRDPVLQSPSHPQSTD